MCVRRTKVVFIVLYHGIIYLKHSCNRFGRERKIMLFSEGNQHKNLLGRINSEQL